LSATSDVVGGRRSWDKTGLETKKWSWSCRSGVMSETRSCYARRHNDLEGQQLFKYYL